MSQYIALMFGSVSMMFFLLNVSLSLNEKHDSLRFFLLSISMVFGWVVGQLGIELAKAAAISDAVTSMAVLGFRTWIIATIVFLLYFGLRFLFAALNSFRQKYDRRPMD